MTATVPTRRATCGACLRPQSACVCAAVARVETPVELLVLLHPLEAGNAKNSGRLLHLCVPGSRIEVGEAFDPAALEEMLHAGGRVPLLLYPPTPAQAGVAQPPGLDRALLSSPQRLRLVVLDATWRKSRKMLYLNPALQKLPRLALSEVPASAYRIRKAHAPHQLSTFEAAAYALRQVTCDEQACQTLLMAFDNFVAQQAAFANRA